MTVEHAAMLRNKAPAIWRMPLVLGALTLFGLLAALLGTGIWHVLSWIAIAVPLLVVAWHVGKTRRTSSG